MVGEEKGAKADTDVLREWDVQQEEIAARVESLDDNTWHTDFDEDGYHGERPLYIAGTDISFPNENKFPSSSSSSSPCSCVATITVVQLTRSGKQLVLSKSRRVAVTNPYQSGYLAFREGPIVNEMLHVLSPTMRRKIDVILLDGNGMLHPRRAGLACHVGVRNNLPAVGVSKSLLCVDGLEEAAVKQRCAATKNGQCEIIGRSGFCWGTAVITGNAVTKPIYISVGHRISLRTATQLVKSLCSFRIPDPIRFADLHSRAYLRGEHTDVEIDVESLR